MRHLLEPTPKIQNTFVHVGMVVAGQVFGDSLLLRLFAPRNVNFVMHTHVDSRNLEQCFILEEQRDHPIDLGLGQEATLHLTIVLRQFTPKSSVPALDVAQSPLRDDQRADDGDAVRIA
jgi:hypothetical protein